MRLTLRTLLAYLDDVLEPNDAKEMGKKIEESEFASGLVHRIRTSTRKLRLGAPAVEKAKVDANLVAEYLDNNLAVEHMAQFERACLDSDVQLAETAACHQILTLVLGDPADVPPATRERIYRIHQPVVSLPPDKKRNRQRGGAKEAASPPPPLSRRSKREVPDYMRSGRRLRLIPIAATLILGLLLALAVFMAVGGPQLVADYFKPTQPVVQNEPSDPPLPPEERAPERGNENEEPESLHGEGDDLTLIDPAVNGVRNPPPGSEGSPSIPPLPPLPPGETEQPEGVIEPDNEGGNSSGEQLAENIPPSEGDPLNENPPVEQPTPPVQPPSQPLPPVEVARLLTEDQILIRYDEEAKIWLRLSPSTRLMSGDRIVSLPTYRSQLLFRSNVLMTIDGGTALQFEGLDADGLPQVRVEYGRVILSVNVSNGVPPGAKIGIGLGDVQGVLSLDDPDSACAVEVSRFRLEGRDPETLPMPIIRSLYAYSGKVHWQNRLANSLGDEPLLAPNGVWLQWINERPPVGQTLDAMPAWIGTQQLSDIEIRGSETLAQNVTEDRPVSLSLQERVQDRRTEVKSLAVRCLAYLGIYDAIFDALGDASQHSSWSGHLDVIREIMSQGPESALAMRRTLERSRGEEAASLYRMLLGYSEEDLAGGSAADLVAALASESLDVRVLAFENLRRITGIVHYYRPEYQEARRRGSTQWWREKLEAGEILYKIPPSSLPGESSEAIPEDEELDNPLNDLD